MDSVSLKNFGAGARIEINNIIGKYRKDISHRDREDLGSQIFLKIIILKYLEVNGFLARIFFKDDQLETRLRESLADYENIWMQVFQRHINFERSRLIEDLARSNFLMKIVERRDIRDENWREIEIIGWLYQYYIYDISDTIIRQKKRYKKEEIPFATQIFTPKWIVNYLIENSLIRSYIENNRREDLKGDYGYYLDNEGELEGRKSIRLEDMTCFDPALGSGNILIGLFDYLYRLYELEGYNKGEIPYLILKNNLYGLEIDSKVYSIASFALMSKAMEYDRGIFKRLKEFRDFKLNISCIEEVSPEELKDLEKILKDQDLIDFIGQYKDSKIYGSLTKVRPNSQELYPRLRQKVLASKYEGKLEKLIHQDKILSGTYQITITNPPYMGVRSLNTKLRKYIDQHYSLGKYDLYSAFIVYCMEKTSSRGEIGLMTPYTWMFIKSYEDLRGYIIKEKSISSLVQLEYSAFSYATVPICIFSLRNYRTTKEGDYLKLSSFKGRENQELKVLEAVKNKEVDYRYRSNMEKYRLLPGSPLAFWASDRIYKIYKNSKSLLEIAQPRQGVATGNNRKYLRFWHEVDHRDIGFFKTSIEDFHRSGKKYAPYNKGGRYRKWYGNLDYVIRFDKPSYDELKTVGNKLPSKQMYFKEGITWSFVSSSYFGARYSQEGFVFDVGGSSVFPSEDNIYYLTGLMCSKLSTKFMNIQNPTLNYQVGDIKNIPVIVKRESKDRIDGLVKEAIELSKRDWESFEESWNFRYHPIIFLGGASLEEDFRAWIKNLNTSFLRLGKIEEKINKEFIKIYGLEEELDPRVDPRDITIRQVKEDFKRSEVNIYVMTEKEAMETVLSYFLGLILGRYSFKGGLITSRDSFKAYDYGPYKPSRSINFNRIYTELRRVLGLVYPKCSINQNIAYICSVLRLREGENFKARIERYFREEYSSYHSRTYKRADIYSIDNKRITYRLV